MNNLFKEMTDISLHNRPIDMPSLFKEEKALRLEKFSLQSGNLFYDYSKNLIDDRVMELLEKIVLAGRISEAIENLFKGAIVNVSEGRPSLHMALRNVSLKNGVLFEENTNLPSHLFQESNHSVMPQVIGELEKMKDIAYEIREGKWRGSTGKFIKTIVNVGIGGSDLGPKMVWRALREENPKISLKFISNIDPHNLNDVLSSIDWEETIFIIVSKTFTTMETMVNAESCKNFIIEKMGDVSKHFIAVSTNEKACQEFGIKRMVGFWDWVGGRYSVWGAVGLSCMIGLGLDVWMEFLSGGNEMDHHFYSSSTTNTKSIPLMMALLGVWYQNGNQASTQAIIPYCERLSLLPAYLQQLDMESNGKRSTLSGEPVSYDTGSIVWGQPGTNGQHAFFQLLHQGTLLCPVDFIISTKTSLKGERNIKQHCILYANCIAQGEALLKGKSSDLSRGDGLWKDFPGNRPSSLLRFDGSFGARELGQLIACYEHKVFCMGKIWDINSFDQWGVELGKILANTIIGDLENIDSHSCGGDEEGPPHDPSTMAHIAAFKNK